jgi:putative flavoprotein involved in K+ transport
VDVLIIGAGQAGLAVSHELTALDVERLVFERGEIAPMLWRDHRESFCASQTFLGLLRQSSR